MPISLSVGGGKGGTGKSFFALNLGIALTESGKNVILCDLDLAGGANLHTFLGIPYPEKTLEDFLFSKSPLESLLLPTYVKGLKLIPGALSNLSDKLKYFEKTRLQRSLNLLRTDYLIVDLGAGISPFTLDFFLWAQKKVVVITPEPTTLENVYRFLRGAYFRYLRKGATERVRKLIDEFFVDHNFSMKKPQEVLNRLRTFDEAFVRHFVVSLKGFDLNVVLNQVKRPEERELGPSFKMICYKYFGLMPKYLGYIPFDIKVSFSINKGRPFLMEYPYTEVAQCVREIASRIISGREMALT
jgi:flagellar biosynthesis protein FlhG